MAYLGLNIIAESREHIRNKKLTLRSFRLFGAVYNSKIHNLLDIVSLAL